MAVTWKKLAYEDDVITKGILTAAGDIIYASGVSTPAVLAVASDGDVLTLAAGVPSWAAPGAPGAHATSHKNSGTDEILLNEFGEPTSAVAFSGQQATDLVVHNVANETARLALTPVIGKMVFQVDVLAFYGCTVAA